MSALRSSATSVRQSQEEVLNRIAVLLAYERTGVKRTMDLHRALRDLGEAIQTASASMRELARVLALDSDFVASEDLDALVPPIHEEPA